MSENFYRYEISFLIKIKAKIKGIASKLLLIIITFI